MANPNDEKRLVALGEARITLALAETMAPVAPVDLDPPPDGEAATGGRYTEQRLLGRGGLGEVVEAFDHDLRRCVALKRPRADRAHAASVASLVREAQITAQLDHPNIPAIHTLGIDAEGRPYFTMTCLHGETLGALLARRRRDPELRNQLTRGRLLRIFAQICYAVAFAHQRGVLHRDLKPQNIILGEFGEVRLMDWGIAKLLREPAPPAETEPQATGSAGAPAGERPARVNTTAETPETRVGTFTGTPGYASPEQAEGRPDIDHRADLYSLGALLYEMLAGRPPIIADHVSRVIEDTVAGRVTPLREVATVSDPLAAIVHKALARDPEERYDSAMALIADLEAMQEGRTVTALEECGVVRAGRWYMARSPRVARMRNIDVDFIAWSSYLLGLASAGMAVAAGIHWTTRFWYLYALVSGLFFLVPAYTMLRRERPDDPGGLLAFTEGVASTTSTRPRGTGRSRAPTPEESAPTQVAPPDQVPTPSPPAPAAPRGPGAPARRPR